MKPFDTLTKRGQLQRLRQVGLSALAAYTVPAPRLIPLHHIENTTFRVLAADQQQYVMRIHRPEGHTLAAIRSEVSWLRLCLKSSITRRLRSNEKQRAVSQALQHESNQRSIDKSNGGRSFAFVIFAQATEVT